MRQSKHHAPYVVVYFEPNYGVQFLTSTHARRSRRMRRALRAARRGDHDLAMDLLYGDLYK